MDFSLAEYVPRAFSQVVAELADRPINVLARATAAATVRRPRDVAVLSGDVVLAVEHGAMTIGPTRLARLPVAWWSPAGVLVVEADLRVLPVEDGTDPVSELLLTGAFRTDAARDLHPVAWLRDVLDALAGEMARTTALALVSVGPAPRR